MTNPSLDVKKITTPARKEQVKKRALKTRVNIREKKADIEEILGLQSVRWQCADRMPDHTSYHVFASKYLACKTPGNLFAEPIEIQQIIAKFQAMLRQCGVIPDPVSKQDILIARYYIFGEGGRIITPEMLTEIIDAQRECQRGIVNLFGPDKKYLPSFGAMFGSTVGLIMAIARVAFSRLRIELKTAQFTEEMRTFVDNEYRTNADAIRAVILHSFKNSHVSFLFSTSNVLIDQALLYLAEKQKIDRQNAIAIRETEYSFEAKTKPFDRKRFPIKAFFQKAVRATKRIYVAFKAIRTGFNWLRKRLEKAFGENQIIADFFRQKSEENQNPREEKEEKKAGGTGGLKQISEPEFIIRQAPPKPKVETPRVEYEIDSGPPKINRRELAWSEEDRVKLKRAVEKQYAGRPDSFSIWMSVFEKYKSLRTEGDSHEIASMKVLSDEPVFSKN